MVDQVVEHQDMVMVQVIKEMVTHLQLVPHRELMVV
jgi:hypothetical protein